jgi:DNA primase catalytic core
MNVQVEQFIRELNLSSTSQKILEERSLSFVDYSEFAIGFCPANSNHNFTLLNGRIVVPIYSVHDKFVAFGGRKVNDYSKDVKNFYQSSFGKLEGLEKFLKWKTSKWINTPYKKSDHLFNLNKAKKSIFEEGFCFIVEGFFDVIHLNKMGYKNCVALCGTALSEKHCELIFRYCNKVCFMLDGDESGKLAAYNSLRIARKNNLFASAVELRLNTDPDDLTKEELSFVYDQMKASSEEILVKI